MTSLHWEKPTITAHQMGVMNKFGSSTLKNSVMDEFAGVKLDDLTKRYGSPLFVFSEKKIRENVRRLLSAFETRYPKVIYGWSYKTNYLSAVCSIMHQEGAWAEVVSRFEYEKARALGVPANQILFNGPHKQRDILERVIEEGGRIHVDNLDELYLIESICEAEDTTIELTIRLNFDTGYTEPWSRFGFNIESGQAMDVATRIANSKYLKLTGLHSHIGTFVMDPRAYQVQVQTMCRFMDEVEQQTDSVIESIDIGGGFPSINALQGIYLPPEQVIPEIEAYAQTICDTLTQHCSGREQRGLPMPTLILESGRSTIDDAAIMLSKVVATKRLADGRRSAVLDAGVNTLFTAFWYDHKVIPTKKLNGIPEDTVLYGPLCMNIDVVRNSIKIPPLSVGDHLVISPVGAYNNTQSMQFIEYRPASVLIDEQQNISVIRQAEDLAVVQGQEEIPPHLMDPMK